MTASGLMQMTHDERYSIKSSGLVVDNSKIAVMAFNVANGYEDGTNHEQRFKISAWNGATNTMIYNKKSVGFRGYSGALINSNSSANDVKYAGGSFAEDGQDSLDWAIIKIEAETSTNPTFTLSRV